MSSEKILLFSIFALVYFASFGIYKTIPDHQAASANSLHALLNYKNGSLPIPMNRSKIRLNAKVPVFIDWKSHPYKADELIEWHAPVLLAKKFYASSPDTDKSEALHEIAPKEKISFILVNATQPIIGCAPVDDDQKSIVYSTDTWFQHGCRRSLVPSSPVFVTGATVNAGVQLPPAHPAIDRPYTGSSSLHFTPERHRPAMAGLSGSAAASASY